MRTLGNCKFLTNLILLYYRYSKYTPKMVTKEVLVKFDMALFLKEIPLLPFLILTIQVVRDKKNYMQNIIVVGALIGVPKTKIDVKVFSTNPMLAIENMYSIKNNWLIICLYQTKREINFLLVFIVIIYRYVYIPVKKYTSLQLKIPV